jgi:hypothetical protein
MKPTTWSSLQDLVEDKNCSNEFTAHMKKEVGTDYEFHSEEVKFDVAALNFLTKRFGQKGTKGTNNALTFSDKQVEVTFNQIIADNKQNNTFAEIINEQKAQRGEQQKSGYTSVSSYDDGGCDDFIFYYMMGYYFGETPLEAYCFSGGSSDAAFGAAIGNEAANSNKGNQSGFFCSSNKGAEHHSSSNSSTQGFFCSSNKNAAASSSSNEQQLGSSSSGGPSNSGGAGGSDGGSAS